MKLIDLKCPNCNHPIPVKEGQNIVRCEYCDSQLFADFGERRLRIINEAELRKVDLMQAEFNMIKDSERSFHETRAKRLKQRKIWLITAIAVHFLFVVMVIISFYFASHSADSLTAGKLFCALFFFNLICPILLSITRPFVPKQTWDKNESSNFKLFLLLLITSISADLTGVILSVFIYE